MSFTFSVLCIMFFLRQLGKIDTSSFASAFLYISNQLLAVSVKLRHKYFTVTDVKKLNELHNLQYVLYANCDVKIHVAVVALKLGLDVKDFCGIKNFEFFLGLISRQTTIYY